MTGCVPEQLIEIINDFDDLDLPVCDAPPHRAALLALYNAADGPNWRNNDNWTSDLPIGEWHGVTAHNGRVIKLHLDNNLLTGTLPSELGSLTNLQALRLSGNRLTGPIPAELGSLEHLQSLRLSGNQLTGAIPAELGSPEYLQQLWLHYNRLTGAIPQQLADLPNLDTLFLSGNQLTGCVPPSLRYVIRDFQRLALPLCDP